MRRAALLFALVLLAGCASNKDALLRAYLYGKAEGRVAGLCAAERLTKGECDSAREIGDQLRPSILAEKAQPDYAQFLSVLDRLMSTGAGLGTKGLLR